MQNTSDFLVKICFVFFYLIFFLVYMLFCFTFVTTSMHLDNVNVKKVFLQKLLHLYKI